MAQPRDSVRSAVVGGTEDSGDRTFKLASGTTSGYGRYVQSLWGTLWRGRCTIICVIKNEISARKLLKLWAPRHNLGAGGQEGPVAFQGQVRDNFSGVSAFVFRGLRGFGAGFDSRRLHHFLVRRSGDRTYKLFSGTTSEYGRYVKSLEEPCRGHLDLGIG